MALTPARTNILPAGISEWAITDSTPTADVGYVAIPHLRNGKVTFDPLTVKNTKQQPLQYGYNAKMSAEFMATRTTANFIALLDSLSTQLVDHRITLNGGQVISSAPSTGTPSPTGFGMGWRLVSDKDFDDIMFIEMTASRMISQTDFNAIIDSTYKIDTAANSADTFYNTSLLARTDIVPAGLTQFECGASGSYGDIISNLRNGKFTASLLTTRPSNPVGYGIDIQFELESMETTEAELTKWKTILERANYSKVTFANGMTCALDLNAGITMNWTSEKDFDDITFLKIAGGGRILTTAFSALFSA
jgi:hypothetical protein